MTQAEQQKKEEGAAGGAAAAHSPLEPVIISRGFAASVFQH